MIFHQRWLFFSDVENTAENNGSIKFTYKFIFWGEMEGADNDDAVSHLKSLNKF